MKILIGFDLMLSYLRKQDDVEGIDMVFNWIDKLKFKKYTDAGSIMLLTHFVSLNEFSRFHGFEYITNQPLLSELQKKLLPLLAYSLHKEEKNWAKVLLMQLNQIIANNADYLITDNIASHRLAELLGIEDRIYTIEEFLERCTAEYRNLDLNKGIAIFRMKLGQLNIADPFFETFKKDYNPYYENVWIKKKAEDEVYVAFEKKRIRALLKLKLEGKDEDYHDIFPPFLPCNRLKISSMKVDYTGEKLGQRFLHIIFMQAVEKKVDEIYVTIVNRSAIRRRLINLLEYWGFKFHGLKDNYEEVYVRSMKTKDWSYPFFYYPFQSKKKPTFIIPIGYNYSQELLPSFEYLKKEGDIEPYKAAIRKIIVLQDPFFKISSNSNLLFYQINQYNQGKIIASGIVNHIKQNFKAKKDFIRYCRKRGILTLTMLEDLWEHFENLMVVDFLYNYSFDGDNIVDGVLQKADVDVNLLKQNKGLRINSCQLAKIINGTSYEKNIIADKTNLCKSYL